MCFWASHFSETLKEKLKSVPIFPKNTIFLM